MYLVSVCDRQAVPPSGEAEGDGALPASTQHVKETSKAQSKLKVKWSSCRSVQENRPFESVYFRIQVV